MCLRSYHQNYLETGGQNGSVVFASSGAPLDAALFRMVDVDQR